MKIPYLFVALATGLFLLTGCASKYHFIEPLSVDFPRHADTIPGTSIAVSWRYNVLEDTGNRPYVQIEKRQGISLLAVRFENFGTDTLLFPEDLLIVVGQDTFPPFYVEEVIAMFERYNQGDGGDMYIDTVEGFFAYLLLFAIPHAVNARIKRKSNEDMAAEMEDYYLVYSTVLPGKKVAGLLALPVVKPGSQLKFFIKNR